MFAPAELTFNERIDLLRKTKMRHTEEKWQALGHMDMDDHGLVLPPAERRKVVTVTSGSGFSIYPVPNDGKFTATIVIPGEDTFSISVYNELGMRVYEMKDINVSEKAQLDVDLNNPSRGIYTVVFQGNDQTVIRKVLVTR